MVSMQKVLVLICVVFFGTACAATPMKTSSLPSKLYDVSTEKAHNAVVVAFQNLGLEIFKENKTNGYVEGGRKPGFARGAETVGVFIESQSNSNTKISIDNRKLMWGYAFAVDWTDKLFKQIDAQLKK